MKRGYKAEIKAMALDDLRLIQRWANEAIEGRLNENRVPLWVVSDDMINYGAFPIDQHDKAVDVACSVLKSRAAKLKNSDLEIKIFKHNFRESEVQDMLELWEE